MNIRRILSIVVPIGAIVLVIGFILTFAIVPMGGGSFAALGDIEKQPDRYVQMVTAPQIGAEAKRKDWDAVEFRDPSAVREQGLLGVLKGGEVFGESGGFGGLELGGTGGGSGAIGIEELGTRGRVGGKFGYGTGVARIRDRGGQHVNVSVGRPVIMGSLSMEIIRRVIRSHRDQIKYCYSKELTRYPNLAGKVAVKFTISPKGYVTQATVSQTTLRNASVERCICEKIRTWKFPEPKGGGIVIVNYPFILQSS